MLHSDTSTASFPFSKAFHLLLSAEMQPAEGVPPRGWGREQMEVLVQGSPSYCRDAARREVNTHSQVCWEGGGRIPAARQAHAVFSPLH